MSFANVLNQLARLTRPARLLLAVLVICIVAPACGANHISPHTPRKRNYEPGKYAVNTKQNKPAPGSLYSAGLAGYLEDTRGLRVGDAVLVRIDEYADASGGATTKLDRDVSRDLDLNAMYGIVPAIKNAYPDVDPSFLLDLASKSNFSGKGETKRAGKLRGSIGVRIQEELPNGDLFVEGTKVVMINHEEYHLYISGVVRPADIQQDNSVVSSRVADAQVEFTGRGDVDQVIERGWLTKILDAINPF